MRDAIALLLMFGGLFFLFVSAVGFIRLPDVYCRLHVTGIIDTMGVPLLLAGAAVHEGFTLTSAKLLLGLVFLFGTSPLVGHLLARAALESGEVASPETRGRAAKVKPSAGGPLPANLDPKQVGADAVGMPGGTAPGGDTKGSNVQGSNVQGSNTEGGET